MFLKFIGADGSMGLTHGKTYDVDVKTKGKYIWVTIPKLEVREKVLKKWECPYSSPQTFSANWETPKSVFYEVDYD